MNPAQIELLVRTEYAFYVLQVGEPAIRNYIVSIGKTLNLENVEDVKNINFALRSWLRNPKGNPFVVKSTPPVLTGEKTSGVKP